MSPRPAPAPASRARRVAVVPLALALFAAGCGGPRAASRRGRLEVWTSHNNAEVGVFREKMKEFAAAFEARRGRPLEVVVSRVAHEGLDTKLKTAALSGTTPDLCRIDVAHVAALAWGRAAVRLDTTDRPLFREPAAREARFVPAALSSNLVALPDGAGGVTTGLFGVPEQTNCLALYYNRALFREAAPALRAAGLDPGRPPATWDEWVAYGRVLARPDANRFAFGMKNTLWWSLPFLYSAGGSIFTPDPKAVYRVALDSPEARRAWGFWVDLTRKTYPAAGGAGPVEGGFWRGEADQHKAFLEGRLAMALSGPWSLPQYRDRVPEVAVAPVPAGPAGSGSTVGGSNLVVLKTCVDREAALDLLEFVSSDAYQLDWSRRLDQIPTTKAALAQAASGAGAALAVFMKQMRTARARPAIPNFPGVERAFQAEMELTLRGSRPLDEALTRIRAEVEREVLGPLRAEL